MTPTATRTRTMYFAWCARTETDRICLTCESIVLGDTCLHCQRRAEKKAEALRKLLESKERSL